MADAAHAQHHDYHLVNPSPWPVIGATSAFLAAVGAILWMHHVAAYAPVIFGVGAIGILGHGLTVGLALGVLRASAFAAGCDRGTGADCAFQSRAEGGGPYLAT